MPEFGYFLSCEEYAPEQLLEQARLAEEAGFDRLWISDHFHPWTAAQGQSPLVWSMIGAISQVCDLPVSTAVTCPTIRVHPAIIAQAAATSAVLLGEGRFTLGVGSGRALNEHVHGDPWPEAAVPAGDARGGRRGHPEAVDRGGRQPPREALHVENARIWTRRRPAGHPRLGLRAQIVDLAARIGDGYVTTSPDRELLDRYPVQGAAGTRTQAGFKVAWAPTKDEGSTPLTGSGPTPGSPASSPRSCRPSSTSSRPRPSSPARRPRSRSRRGRTSPTTSTPSPPSSRPASTRSTWPTWPALRGDDPRLRPEGPPRAAPYGVVTPPPRTLPRRHHDPRPTPSVRDRTDLATTTW